MTMPLRFSAPLPRAVDLQALAAGIAFTVNVAMPFGAASAQEPTPLGASMARERIASTEIVAEIRVHGNLSVPDAEVIALAGVSVGEAADPDLAEIVRDRLTASGRFETVDVRRRYRSLTATDQVALVIVVRERPGARFSNPVVRALAGLGRRLMVAPIIDHREGYGVAYGALTSVVDALGPGSRLSVPATWGGHSASRPVRWTPVAPRVRGNAVRIPQRLVGMGFYDARGQLAPHPIQPGARGAVLEPRDRRLRGQGGAGHRVAPEQQLVDGVVGEMLGVVAVGMTAGDAEDPLAENQIPTGLQ